MKLLVVPWYKRTVLYRLLCSHRCLNKSCVKADPLVIHKEPVHTSGDAKVSVCFHLHQVIGIKIAFTLYIRQFKESYISQLSTADRRRTDAQNTGAFPL